MGKNKKGPKFWWYGNVIRHALTIKQEHIAKKQHAHLVEWLMSTIHPVFKKIREGPYKLSDHATTAKIWITWIKKGLVSSPVTVTDSKQCSRLTL